MSETPEHGRLELPERRRLAAPVPVGLAVLLIAGIGFIAGALVQKHSGGGSAGSAGLLSGAAFGAGGPQAPGTASGSAVPTVGTVKSVEDGTLYVSTTGGTTIKIEVGAGATVSRSASAKAGDVRPGDTVIVQGARKKNGTVTASTVTASEAGTAAGGPGLLAAGSAPSTGTTTAAGSASPAGGSAGVNSLFARP